jgi:hypothetical protein
VRTYTPPTHAEIALQAEWLWRKEGCPLGKDELIWLEAERQVDKIPQARRYKWDLFSKSNPLSRLDRNSDDVMAELEELFPPPAGTVSTAL